MKIKSLIITLASVMVLGFGLGCEPQDGEHMPEPPSVPETPPNGYEQPPTFGETPPAPADPGEEPPGY